MIGRGTGLIVILKLIVARCSRFLSSLWNKYTIVYTYMAYICTYCSIGQQWINLFPPIQMSNYFFRYNVLYTLYSIFIY